MLVLTGSGCLCWPLPRRLLGVPGRGRGRRRYSGGAEGFARRDGDVPVHRYRGLGGCTLVAAEAVCDANLDTLASLLDKSLVRRRTDTNGDERF